MKPGGTYTRSSASSKRKLKDGSVPEKTIQSAILRWLKSTGLFHWRAMAGHLFVGRRKYLVGPSGLPDVIVIIPPNGRFLGLEVKSARGKLRPAQKEFMLTASKIGALYKVVRSVKEAQAAVAQALGEEQCLSPLLPQSKAVSIN